VSQLQQSSIGNRLLAALSLENFVSLQPHLEPVELKLRDTLIEPNQSIEHVYFPEQGIASIINNSHDGKIEVGIVGREGMTGTPVLLGVDRTPLECFIQVEGYGHRMNAQQLATMADQAVSLRRSLLRFIYALNVQTSQTAFANANNTTESRLAR
jgi:hypothetical protein